MYPSTLAAMKTEQTGRPAAMPSSNPIATAALDASEPIVVRLAP
jgi:hypothetical protein